VKFFADFLYYKEAHNFSEALKEVAENADRYSVAYAEALQKPQRGAEIEKQIAALDAQRPVEAWLQ
jgi:hypothetical protein